MIICNAPARPSFAIDVGRDCRTRCPADAGLGILTSKVMRVDLFEYVREP